MRFSHSLIPTVKEAPADATNVSHTLLTRAGFIRRVGAGSYDFLPLGLRVLRKIERLVRDEMDRAGALEILMPVLLPAEYFKETGRWDRFGDALFRLTDRKKADFHLGPTHEEIVTDIARREIHSYRDLPKNLYQIQTKFRDEPRPRGGLLRCREFMMKDAYSFDVDEDGARASYERMRVAYACIFDRLGLVYRMVAADSGAMGGSVSAEFQVLADSGEDAIVACDACTYAANLEVATVRPVSVDGSPPSGAGSPAKIHTPGTQNIASVAAFLKIKPEAILKSLLYRAGADVVMVVVRGDHEVNEVRLARAAGVDEVFLASEAEVARATGASFGFVGPVGYSGKVFIDRAAASVRASVVGANIVDYHLENVEFERDFRGEVIDVRLAQTGDTCPECGKGSLTSYKGIEGGHIFILGSHYSQLMGALYVDEAQQKKPLIMGCYGIGISRLMASAIEQHNDADGMLWPVSIAPYHVHLCTLGKDDAVNEAAQKLYTELTHNGIEVLWDDRDERPGVKFKDADLIGLPLRITLGGKNFAAGVLEAKLRTETDPKKADLIPLAEAAGRIAELLKPTS